MQLTEEENKALIARAKEFAQNNLRYNLSEETNKELRAAYELSVVNNLLSKISTHESNEYIDLEFHFRNGQIIKIDVLHKNKTRWNFFSDYVGLLSFTGIVIEWPSLEGLTEKEKLDTMNKTFKLMYCAFLEVIDVFEDVAMKDITRPARGGSLSERYQQKGNEEEAVLNILLKNLEAYKAKSRQKNS